jgi:hypothetical protein
LIEIEIDQKMLAFYISKNVSEINDESQICNPPTLMQKLYNKFKKHEMNYTVAHRSGVSFFSIA